MSDSSVEVARGPISSFERMKQFAAQSRAERGAPASAPAPVTPLADVIEITGTVDGVQVYGGNWGRGVIISDKYVETRITGNLVAELKPNQEYVVTGVYRQHERYGRSLEISSARPHVQLNEKAIARFLVANYEGVGPKSAQKYIAGLLAKGGAPALEAFRKQLIEAPWGVDVAAINSRGSYSAEERDKASVAFIQRDLATRFVGIDGVRAPVLTALAKRLAAQLPPPQEGKPAIDPVATSWARLCENPYEAIGHVSGYSFLMADAIGRMINLPRDAPQRLAALVAHATKEGCQMAGHVFLTMAQVRQAIQKVDGQASASRAIECAKEAKTIAVDATGPVVRVYPYALLKAEESLAASVVRMCEPSTPLMSTSKEMLVRRVQGAAKSLGGAFVNGVDGSQLDALCSILSSRRRIHTVTAEPGAGKTSIMEVLTKALPNKRFVFCAPTGQASKVLGNRLKSVGYTACTIHSLLQGSSADDFQVNEDNTLDGDILVIDEGSMPDLALGAATFRAVPESMHVIVLGDVGQLQSIDSGRVLADLLEVPEIDHCRLTEVHRNAGALLEVVKQIRNGDLDTTSRGNVKFSGKLPDADTGMAEVVAKYVDAVGKSDYSQVGLLMSRRKGKVDEPGWNTTYVNDLLRRTCNPNAERVPGSTMHVNDRIIIKDNMAVQSRDGGEVRVVNGDTGTIRGYRLKTGDSRERGAEAISITLDDGRNIDFPGAMASSLQWSWALTVHSTQGSQYKDVLCVMTGGNAAFVNRNMFYTGASRARSTLEVFGDDSTLKQIARTPAPERNSALVERIRAALDEDDDAEGQAAAARAVPGPERLRA